MGTVLEIWRKRRQEQSQAAGPWEQGAPGPSPRPWTVSAWDAGTRAFHARTELGAY